MNANKIENIQLIYIQYKMDTIRKIAEDTIKEWNQNDSHYIFEEVFDQRNPNNRLCFTEEECYKLVPSAKDLWSIVQYHGKPEQNVLDLINNTWEKVGRELTKS